MGRGERLPFDMNWRLDWQGLMPNAVGKRNKLFVCMVNSLAGIVVQIVLLTSVWGNASRIDV